MIEVFRVFFLNVDGIKVSNDKKKLVNNLKYHPRRLSLQQISNDKFNGRLVNLTG